MSSPEQVLGNAARELAAARRAAAFTESLEALLQQRIRALTEGAESRVTAPATSIPELQQRLEETQASYREASIQVERLERRYRELSRGIVSIWRRLGILIRKCVRPRSPGIAALREHFAELGRELEQAEDRRDYAGKRRARLQRDLRRAEAAVQRRDSIRDALQRQLRQTQWRRNAAGEAVRALIRRVARRIDPAMLMVRHDLSPSSQTARGVLADLVELRNVLLQHVVLSAQLAVSRDPRSHEITLRAVRDAVQTGFAVSEGSGTGSIHLSGPGEHHVKRSRVRSETYRDAQGKRKTRRRRETYWQRRPVAFSGELPVRFSISGRQWRADALGETLWDEAGDWLEQGYREQRAAATADELRGLQERADNLVERILGTIA